jgi:hypothetical protein
VLRGGLLEGSKAAPSVAIPGRRTQFLSIAFALLVFCAFAIPVAERMSGYVVRATFRHATGYNEGWNTYYSGYAAAGRPLYGKPPDRLAANYPPLSFHLEGALGRVTGNLNFAGRILSLAALFWVALCAGFTVCRLSGDPWASMFAALFCVAWFCFFAPTCVGVNDPQMLGHGIMLTGVALYAASEHSATLLAASSIFFCIGGFTKHNLVAFPVAITLDILLRSRRRFLLWITTTAATICLLAGLTVWVDGPYGIQHLLAPRRYLVSHAISISGIFLRIFFPTLVLSAIWCSKAWRSPARFLAFAVPIAFAVGAAFSGGGGVFVNVFYDAMIAMAMIAALVLAEFRRRFRPGSPAWCAAIVVIPIVFSVGPILAGLYSTAPPRSTLARQDRAYAEDVAYLKSRPGQAICFDLLLCHDAGKPLVYEHFAISQLLSLGLLDPRTLAAELAAGKYGVVQSEENFAYLPPLAQSALLSRYRIDRRSALSVFYVPGP